MQKTNKLNIRYYVLRLVAMMVVLAIIVGSVPVSAAKSKKVSSVDELSQEIEESASGTFVLNTEESIKINIPAKLGNAGINLVINAPNATITNNAVFNSVSITGASSYTEKVSGNNISLKDKNTKFIVYKKKTIEKLTVYSAVANIKLQKKAKIKELIFSKKASKGNIAAEAGSVAKVMLKKKANLTITGSKKANITIYGNSKNSAVTTSVPVVLYANKNMKFNMEKGSEGSVIDSASGSIKVNVSNKSAKDPIRKVAGVDIKETNTSETKVTTSPKPTVTPTPKPTTTQDNSNSVSLGSGVSGNSNTSVGGGSSNGNSGGAIIGYPEGGNSASYTGGGNSGGSYTGGGDSGSIYSGGGSSWDSYTGNGSSSGYYDNGNSGNNSGSIVDNSANNNSGDNQSSGGVTDETTDITESGNSIGNEGTSGKENTDGTVVEEDVPETVLKSVNILNNNYRVWSNTVKSHLFVEDGFLYRVEALPDNEAGKVYIEKYSTSWEYIESKVVEYDKDLIWGGFYHGSKYNFIILGQKNMEEDEDRMVIRVIKYDRQWNELGYVDLNGADTSNPFDAGSLRCAENDGYLFVLTGHQMYKSEDGKRHQSNMFLIVDEENMVISYPGWEMMHPGYCSHSFNQFVIVNDKGQFVTADHGDGFPRGIAIARYDVESGVYTGIARQMTARFGGDFNSNNTGASLGGLEETNDGYIVVYNDDEKGGIDQVSIRNIYVDFISKKRIDSSTNTYGTRIEYSSDDNTVISSSTPVIVSMGRDKGGYILWEEIDYNKYGYGQTLNKVCYVKYGVDGSVTNVISFEGNLSDCKPVYEGEKILWYVTGHSERKDNGWNQNTSSAPYLYEINNETGEVCRTMVNGAKEILATCQENKGISYFTVESDGGTTILFGKDIFDDNGKLVETEYYTAGNELYSRAVYTYDENGFLIGKLYKHQDSTYEDTVYEYYTGTRLVKSVFDKTYSFYNDFEYYSEYYESGKEKSYRIKQTIFKPDDSGEISSINEEEYKWLEDGTLIEKDTFKFSGNKSTRTVSLFYANGNVKQETAVIEYSQGDIVRSEVYYTEDGKKTRAISERNGVLTSETIYDEQERKVKYTNGAFHSVSTYDYHDDGTYTVREVYSEEKWNVIDYDAGNIRLKEEEHNEKGITIREYLEGYKVLSEEYNDGTEENVNGYVLNNSYNEEDDGFTQVKEFNNGRKEVKIYKNSYHVLSETIIGTAGEKTVKEYDKEVAYRLIKEEFVSAAPDNIYGYLITYTYNEDGSYEKVRINNDNSKDIELYDKNNKIVSFNYYYGDGNNKQIRYPLTQTATGSSLIFEYFNDDETNSLKKRYTTDYDLDNDIIQERTETYNEYGLYSLLIYEYDNSDNKTRKEKRTYFFSNGEVYFTKLYDCVYNPSKYFYDAYLRSALEYYEDEKHTLKSTFEISEVSGKQAAVIKYYNSNGKLSIEKVDFATDTAVWNYNIAPNSGYMDYLQDTEGAWSRYIYEEGVLQKRIDFVNGLPSKYYIYQNNEFVETDPFEY